MKRSLSVTVSAIVVVIASAFTVLLGILSLATTLFFPAPTQSPQPFGKGALVFAMLLILILPGIWGVVTGIGLFALKRWARISILIFSALLTLVSLCGFTVFLLMPFPSVPNSDPSSLSEIRAGLLVLYIFVAGIGIVWLVLFNRRAVKAQFFAGSPSSSNERPVSISVIAWLFLLGGVFTALLVFSSFPAAFFGFVVSGWNAKLLYSLYTAVCLYLGIGLLRLRPRSRTLAIYYLLFAGLNGAFFYLSPDYAGRMSRLVKTNPGFFHNPQHTFVTPVAPMVVFLVIYIGIQVYFLITRKSAFRQQSSAPA